MSLGRLQNWTSFATTPRIFGWAMVRKLWMNVSVLGINLRLGDGPQVVDERECSWDRLKGRLV